MKVTPNDSEIEDYNIGIKQEPKIMKLSKSITSERKQKYISLVKELSDVFVWICEDLNVYGTHINQHTIPIKEYLKSFKKKIRRLNPLLLPLIEKEVKKLFHAKINVSLRFSKWLANLVLVRKKNGEIRLCVVFRNFNEVSLKDNYPLPKMDHIL